MIETYDPEPSEMEKKEKRTRQLLQSKNMYYVPHPDDVQSKKWWIINELFPQEGNRLIFQWWVSPEDAFKMLSYALKGSKYDINDDVPWKSLEMKAIVKSGNTWEEYLKEENEKKSTIEWGMQIASI